MISDFLAATIVGAIPPVLTILLAAWKTRIELRKTQLEVKDMKAVVQQVKVDVDGRLTQLLDATRSLSHEEGRREGGNIARALAAETLLAADGARAAVEVEKAAKHAPVIVPPVIVQVDKPGPTGTP